MTTIARNAPCPCASGRKFKLCCDRSYTAADRRSAIRKMMKLLAEPAFAAWEEQRLDEFDSEVDAGFVHGEDDEVNELMSDDTLMPWLLYDAPVGDGPPLVDQLLGSSPTLSRGERNYLVHMRASSLRLYDVLAVRPAQSITVRDVVGDEDIIVAEAHAPCDLKAGDLLAARVVPNEEGRLDIDGGSLRLVRQRRDHVLAAFHEALGAFCAAREGASTSAFYKACPPLLHRLWHATLPFDGPEEIVNLDGDPITFMTISFAVADPARVSAALDASSHLQREPAGDAWRWAGAERTTRVSFGRLALHGERLQLDVNSRGRAERGRALVEAAAGDLVRHVSTTSRGSGASTPDTCKKPQAGLHGSQETHALIEDMLLEHYVRWVDEPIPLFDNTTPRKAARSPRLRRRLIEMLRRLEHDCKQARAQDQPVFDPAWLWDELGLGAPR
jgi:hypothetical protein